jgi:Zn ribbon nucleic-acid-binding protein
MTQEAKVVQESEVTNGDLCSVDPWYWAWFNKIRLHSEEFTEKTREYQIGVMQSHCTKRVYKKATSLGFTESEVLRTLHGMIYGHYPKGVLYLFPTGDDVSDFSKTRFNPLIRENQRVIGQYVQNTNSTEVKQIGKAILYLRGARATQKVENEKKESSKLRSIPVDKVVFDEVDLMDPAMIYLALQRMGDSKIKEEVYISTPTIPDFGIDKLYNESDQQWWIIKCPACNKDCCLEMDFPHSVQFKNGKAYRACVKCGHELNPSDGEWVAQFSGKEFEGKWISRLNSLRNDPGEILRQFENPPDGNIAEVYNSILGMAYIAAENRLSINDVLACCGPDILSSRDQGPCGMGVDVGKTLHVVIGKKPYGTGKKKIVWMGEVKEFEDLVELARRYGVTQGAIDYEPETRKAREWQKDAGFPVYLCDEMDKVREGQRTDEGVQVTKIARTELCDMTNHAIKKREYILPRKCPQVDEYAKQLSNMAKILEEDEKRGTKTYRYRKLGTDHFYHATNFFDIAVRFLPEAFDDPIRDMARQFSSMRDKPYNPLTFGLP